MIQYVENARETLDRLRSDTTRALMECERGRAPYQAITNLRYALCKLAIIDEDFKYALAMLQTVEREKANALPSTTTGR